MERIILSKFVPESMTLYDSEAGRKMDGRLIRESCDPQNVGRMMKPDGMAEITGSCGDTMEFYIMVEDGKIRNINFYTDGCFTTIACGSVTTKMVMDRNIEEALNIMGQDIMDKLGGLPEDHNHCAKLAAETLHKAITNFLTKSKDL